MKIRFYTVVAICILVGISALGGCGRGSDQSGALVQLSTMVTPSYNGNFSNNVDVAQGQCLSSPTSSAYNEFFSDHNATATFLATLTSPSMRSNVIVTLEKYTITYKNASDSPTAPPIDTAAFESTFVMPVSSVGQMTFSTNVSFMDIIRKSKYYAYVLAHPSSATGLLNNYIATYTFEGHDNFGVKYSVSASQTFEVGDFINCAPNDQYIAP